MKKLNSYYPVAGAILMLALHNVAVKAEQVQMYDRPPSAEEMGRLLFKHQTSSQAVKPMKTRSLGFAPKAPSDMEIAQRVQAERTSIGLPIKFGYNSAEILPESIPFLQEIGKMLTLSDFSQKKLIIEGHTDATGTEAYNQQLSRLRAQAVKNFLASHFGIAGYRLETRGVGESEPLPGKNPFDGANRRVQFYSAN